MRQRVIPCGDGERAIGTFGESFDDFFEAAKSIKHSFAFALVYGTRGFAVDAEGAAVVLDVVPIAELEAAQGIFHVQILRHVFQVRARLFHHTAAKHDEVRFTEDVRMEFVFQPEAEDVHAVMLACSKIGTTKFFEIAVEMGGVYVFITCVMVLKRDDADSRIGFHCG